MELPENASESLASSVPYGSLNESQFRYPSQLSKSHGSAKYLHHPYNNVISNENSPHTSTSTMNNNSKNNNNEPYYNLQQRVQQMKSNGTLIKNETKSGLAALLGDNNDEQRSSNMNNNKIGSNNTKTATGIGALLEGRGSSNSSMIRDTNDIDSYQPQSQQQQHQQQQSAFPSSIKIGSTSTNTSMLTNSINTARGIGMSVPYSQPIQFQLSNDNITQTTNHRHQNEHQLSGSLTGLDILKQTPHNRLAKLSPDQTKAMLGIQARSRSYSEDVNTFLSQQQQQQVENDSFEDFDGRDNNNHHGRHIQRGISDDDSVGEGKDDHHPDIDGAFDLDLDG